MKNFYLLLLIFTQVIYTACTNKQKTSYRAGIYIENGETLGADSEKMLAFAQAIGCQELSERCKLIVNISKQNQTYKISLKDSSDVTIIPFESQEILLNGLKKGFVDIALGTTDWEKAVETERKDPSIYLKSSLSQKIKVETNLDLKNFVDESHKLSKTIFFNQIKFVGTSGEQNTKNLISPNKITEFLASTDKKIPHTNLAKIAKLTPPLNSKNAKLYIEPRQEFEIRKSELLKQNTPFIRISSQKSEKFTDGLKVLAYNLKLPLLYNQDFKNLITK